MPLPSRRRMHRRHTHLPMSPDAAAVARLRAALPATAGGKYLEHHLQRLALDLQWLLDCIDPAASVLEVGASPFHLTCAAARHGYRIVTVDFPAAAIARRAAELGVASVSCDIEREPLPFPPDSFDEVLFNEVFEHLRIDPTFTVGEVLRVLRPGGRLWLSTPNLLSLRGWINLLLRQEAWSVSGGGVYRQYRPLRAQEPMLHVREYTGPEVVRFLRDAGFAVELLRYRGAFANALARSVCAVAPRMRPYFSVLARKPESASA